MLWALVHAFVFAALVLGQAVAGAGASVPDPTAPNPVWVTVVCPLLLLADVARRGERALWGNLGVSTTQLAVLRAVVCAAGETLLALIRR